MSNVDPFMSDITSPFLPLVLVFFIAYAIATVFMMIYGMAIDSILMCFLYDEEMNKGKGAPKNCPELLREFFEENEKK
jgi:solute carrier family 44 (choline transporter-like protein), member 2/4/5